MGWTKTYLRNLIASHRQSPIVQTMHRAAAFVDSSWRNEGSDFTRNGEEYVLQRFSDARFRQAVDAGANLGDWTRAASRLWPTCRIDAFEVVPETYRQLAKQVHSTTGAERIAVHGAGLSDRSGPQTMYYYPENSQLSCDMPRHQKYKSVEFTGEMTTLDSFCAEERIESIDYLKIDVEGSEFRVLRGAEDLLRNKRIACIQFEYGAFSIQTRFLLKDYYDLLGPDFVIGKIFPNHVDFGEYDWKGEDFRFSNYLCVLRDRADLQLLVNR